jgi:hypothetical protein
VRGGRVFNRYPYNPLTPKELSVFNKARRAEARQYRKDKAARIAKNRKTYRDKMVKIVFGHYGTKCSICGGTTKLCIDHQGGHDKQEKYRVSLALYRWLIANKFPPGFRTLCNDCNVIDGLLRKNKRLRIVGIDELIRIRRAVKK